MTFRNEPSSLVHSVVQEGGELLVLNDMSVGIIAGGLREFFIIMKKRKMIKSYSV